MIWISGKNLMSIITYLFLVVKDQTINPTTNPEWAKLWIVEMCYNQESSFNYLVHIVYIVIYSISFQ